MTNLNKIGLGLAGVAALAVAASPASAQYYPQQPYPQQPYAQPNGGVLGAIIGAVTGNSYAYGQYPQGNYGYGQLDSRLAVQQCAAAVEQRTGAGGGYGYNNGYGNQGYNPAYGNQGYNQGYQAQGGARVVGITSIERKSRGQLRVKGVAASNAYAGGGYQGQFDPRYQNRDPRYPNQYGNQGQYGNRAYGTGQADLGFNCKVDLQGRVTDLKITRSNNSYYRR